MDRIHCTKDEAQEESRRYSRKEGDHPERFRSTISLSICEQCNCECQPMFDSSHALSVRLDQDFGPQAADDPGRVRRVSPINQEA